MFGLMGSASIQCTSVKALLAAVEFLSSNPILVIVVLLLLAVGSVPSVSYIAVSELKIDMT